MSKNELGSIALNVVGILLGAFVLVTNGKVNLMDLGDFGLVIYLVASLVMLLGVVLKKKVNDVYFGIVLLKYIATVLEVMALLGIVILSFNTNNYLELLKDNFSGLTLLIKLVVMPLVSLMCFVVFEGDRRLNKKKTMSYPVLICAAFFVCVLALDYANITKSNYFLLCKEAPVYLSAIGAILFIGISYLAARLILLNNQIRAPRIKLKR